MGKIIDFNSDGGSSSFTYSISGTCDNISVGDVSFSGNNTWLTVTNSTASTQGTVTISAAANTGENSRNGTVLTYINNEECTSHSFTVNQEGVNCDCSGVHFTTTSVTLPAYSSGGVPIMGYIEYSACNGITATTATTNDSWLSIGSLDKTNKKIQIIASVNTPVSERHGSVTLSYNGPSCSSSITFTNITQEKPDCDCATSSIGLTAKTVGYESASGITIGKFETYCVDNLTFTSSTITNIQYQYTGYDGYMYQYNIKGDVPINTSTANTVTHTVTPKFGSTSCTSKAMSVTQNAAPCNCLTSNLSITPRSTNIPYSGNPYDEASHDLLLLGTVSSNCNGTIDFYSADIPFITISGSAGTSIYGYGISENPYMTDRTLTVDVYFNGEPCTSFTLTQTAKPCLCSDFEFEEPTTKNYFSITPLNGNYTMGQIPYSTCWVVQYSFDGDNWNSLPAYQGDPTTLLNVPQYSTVMLRCTTRGSYQYAWVTTTNTIELKYSGNIMSMVYGDDFEDKTSFPSGYVGIKDGLNLGQVVDASELILPATTLVESCYQGMFSGMTKLKYAPKTLPATAPAASAYCQMFYGCTALAQSPKIEALTLSNSTCKEMFRNCTNLNQITCLATDISATDSTKDWVYGISSGSYGTFYKNPSMTSWTTGADGIPLGWNVN